MKKEYRDDIFRLLALREILSNHDILKMTAKERGYTHFEYNKILNKLFKEKEFWMKNDD